MQRHDDIKMAFQSTNHRLSRDEDSITLTGEIKAV